MKKLHVLALTPALALLACAEAKKEAPKEAAAPVKAAEAVALKTDKGVDAATKTIRLGALNDESGPAAAIGKPYAWGKRILAAEVNAGGSGVLPEGWKVELIEKDHGYNPGKAQQAYESIKDDVLAIATSFGTPATLPLRPFLKRDTVVAFPASLSSQMAEYEFTPPAGPSYVIEARRAMDWVLTTGDKGAIKPAIIYDQTDYGKDGIVGWQKAAKQHGIEIVAERAVKPGQKDFTADITALKKAGATHVLLTVLPSSTGPILGTAAKMKYMPTWIGNTPAWIDAFFAHPKLPPPVFSKFYWVPGEPYWGEEVAGMKAFLTAYDKYGKGKVRPDFYVLMSYVQGRIALEAAKRAIDKGDITRAGYLAALKSIENWDMGGLVQPITLTTSPYVTSTKTRILKADFEKKTWTSVAGYAEPAGS